MIDIFDEDHYRIIREEDALSNCAYLEKLYHYHHIHELFGETLLEWAGRQRISQENFEFLLKCYNV
jgi:hypothetical protein